ncbi:hypothetical protein [Mesorhizobium sp. CO1-1-8]|uniref:hypothetical protein n=1 Tax=Mesorhizobium sp. CO1-1-8 TaxID=2876631 RepID=UPI00398F5DD6
MTEYSGPANLAAIRERPPEPVALIELLSCLALSANGRTPDATTKKASPKGLNELFHDTLKDIYFAKKKILATAKNGEGCSKPRFEAAFERTARNRRNTLPASKRFGGRKRQMTDVAGNVDLG